MGGDIPSNRIFKIDSVFLTYSVVSMKTRVALLIVILLFPTATFSQRVDRTPNSQQEKTLLMLQKKNKNKNAYYKAGDEITFQLKGLKSKIRDEIIEIKDSVLVFKGYTIPVKEIKCLYVDEKTKWWLRYKIAQLTLIAGTGYLLLDVINTGQLSRETLNVTAMIISVGVIARLLISNKIKGRTKLRVLRL